MINLYPSSYLYDGFKGDLYTKDFLLNLSNGDTITFKVDDITQRILDKDFKDSPFYKFIKDDIELKKSLVHGSTYRHYNLKLNQHLIISQKTAKAYTVIAACGELQPARYQLWMGGVWEENV